MVPSHYLILYIIYMYIYINDTNFFITMSVDALAPNSARPSAGVVMAKKGRIFFLFKFPWLSIILNNIIGFTLKKIFTNQPQCKITAVAKKTYSLGNHKWTASHYMNIYIYTTSSKSLFNSLWPSDLWQHKSVSKLVQVMAFYLTAPPLLTNHQ